jgi:hypothetical protein
MLCGNAAETCLRKSSVVCVQASLRKIYEVVPPDMVQGGEVVVWVCGEAAASNLWASKTATIQRKLAAESR